MAAQRSGPPAAQVWRARKGAAGRKVLRPRRSTTPAHGKEGGAGAAPRPRWAVEGPAP